MKSQVPTKKEKNSFISSMKMTHLGPPQGGLYGIIKGFKLNKRTKIHKGRFILNTFLSIIPILFGLIFPDLFYYSVGLSILTFIMTGFIILPIRTIEIDYNDLGSEL